MTEPSRPIRPLALRLVAVNVCEWRRRDRSQWRTDCGALWELPDDTDPPTLGVLYCPQCGGRLKMVPPS